MHARTHARTDACVTCGTATYLFREERKTECIQILKILLHTYVTRTRMTALLLLLLLLPFLLFVHSETTSTRGQTKNPPPSHVIVFEAFCLGFIIVEKEEVLY